MKPVVLLIIASCALAAQNGPIPLGSALDADRQIAESQQLAKALLSAGNPQQRAKGR